MTFPLNGALQQFPDGLTATLLKKELITHDSYIFTFGLPDPNQTLGFRPGNHIALQ